MTTILSLIPWWEPVLIILAILAVVFEKRLIVFEKRLIVFVNQLGRAIARLWRKHARYGKRASRIDTPAGGRQGGRLIITPTTRRKQKKRGGNEMTTKELIRALRTCAGGSCRNCPYIQHSTDDGSVGCINQMVKDAADAIEQLSKASQNDGGDTDGNT